MYYTDLLKQAQKLAKSDLKRPKHANLRRALSSAYYSLFHFLVDQSCRAIIGTRLSQAPYRYVIGRAFAHSHMKNACESFAGGTLKLGVRRGLPASFAIPPEIIAIASTFVELQEKRHLADYDLTEQFYRSDVLTVISQVDADMQSFKSLANSNEKSFFLACLWAWNSLAGRR